VFEGIIENKTIKEFIASIINDFILSTPDFMIGMIKEQNDNDDIVA
jgi:hypothetical protein